jgi:hypothetical protein
MRLERLARRSRVADPRITSPSSPSSDATLHVILARPDLRSLTHPLTSRQGRPSAFMIRSGPLHLQGRMSYGIRQLVRNLTGGTTRCPGWLASA